MSERAGITFIKVVNMTILIVGGLFFMGIFGLFALAVIFGEW